MVHNAFDSCELLSDCSMKIESVASYGSKLLLGGTDGSLRICCPASSDYDRSMFDLPSPTEELAKDSYVLEGTLSGFSKKPLIAMQVLCRRQLLLSLSEAIAFHRLPSFETITVITKAKGANVFAWDDQRGFLCFARQRRVLIFRHDGGGGFVEVKDFGIPDSVKSMCWGGENICLGIRREYMILNATYGTLSEVFSSGRIAPPLVVSLSSGELLLGKDNIGVFVDQNGKLLSESRICWSEPPSAIIIKKPYAIAHLPKHIEIRSLRPPYPLVQTVLLRNIRYLSMSNNVVMAILENSVNGLFPVPIGAQIVQLTASGNFEEALALCKLLPSEDSNLRAAKEGSIHLRYAHHLFESRSYEDAMKHFLASQADIKYVLSLYPSIVLPKSATVCNPDSSVDISSDGTYFSTGSSGISDDPESSSSQISGNDENSELDSKKTSHNSLMPLIEFLQKKRQSIIGKATAEGTEEAVFDAVTDTFVPYDSSKPKKMIKGWQNATSNSGAREIASLLDTALLQALLYTGQPSAAIDLLKGPCFCNVKICEEVLRHTGLHLALLELYKSNWMHREALKLLHHLIELSNSNQPQNQLAQKFKPDMIIEYLKPLCGTDPLLVLEFSMPALKNCPTQTIDLFLSGNIKPDLVNSYLKKHAPDLQTTYLELMLSMNESGISSNLQNEMIQIYLSEVVDWQADLAAHGKWNEKEYSATRRKLLSALDSMPHYNPGNFLKSLPLVALYEEHAILLGKMNQHELALTIYVHKLHEAELALAYCDRVYEASLHQQSRSYSNVYLILLQIYLNPGVTTRTFERRVTNFLLTQSPSVLKGGSGSIRSKGGRQRKIAEIEGAEEVRSVPSGTDSGRSDGDMDETTERELSTAMLNEVLDVLIRRWDRINGAQALRLLPKHMKLRNLLPFVEPLLRKSSESNRNFSVIKNLRQKENLQVKEDLYRQRKTVVKIGSGSTCSICNKKIGTTVFAVYPNGGKLVHFVCYRDSQSMKVLVTAPPLRKNG